MSSDINEKILKKAPTDLSKMSGKLQTSAGEEFPVDVYYRNWNNEERRKRAFKKTSKIIGMIFVGCIPALFVHILLLIAIPTLFVASLASIPLFMKFLNEKSNFFYAKGSCPKCRHDVFRHYLDSQMKDVITAQCPNCGETFRILLPTLNENGDSLA